MNLLLEVAKAEASAIAEPAGGWSVGQLAHLGLMLSCKGFRVRFDHHNLNLLFDIVEDDDDGEVRATNGDIIVVEPHENGVILYPPAGFDDGLLLGLKTLKEMGIEQVEEDDGQPSQDVDELDDDGTISEVENLEEGIRKAFKRSGGKIKRGFRVTSGFRKGRVVSSAKAAFKPRKKATTRMKLKLAGRRKKIVRIMKGKRTRRRALSKRLAKMNKAISPKTKK